MFVHEPVMATEILDAFSTMEDGTFLDATLGGAGHSAAILAAHPAVSLLGLDQDPHALSAARAHLDAVGLGGRATLRRARFDSIALIAAEEGIGSLAGALFDLGVSSPQFDVAERGFSYRFDGPLDMRMDPDAELTAHDVVNNYTEIELARVLRDHADERFAGRIAGAIVRARPLRSTVRLSDVVAAAIPAPARRRGGHPAKRTFQAIRIEVNGELRILPDALAGAFGLLAPGARLAVLSYHSGEDRIVKAFMRGKITGGCTCRPGLPCGCGAVAQARRVRTSETATPVEVDRNPRAASARLRVVERLAGAGED